MSPAERFSNYGPRFARTAKSFRPISDRELASIRDLRLKVVTARTGERFADLSRRTGNRWTGEETAVANGLPLGTVLAEGQRVKVAVEVPYRR